MRTQLQAKEPVVTAPRAEGGKMAVLRARPELVLIPALFLLITAAWEFGTRAVGLQSYVLPKPSEIVVALADLVQSDEFRRHLLVTLTEVLVGFAVGGVCAFLLGSAISQSRIVEKTLLPYIVALQTVPKIALAPLLIIWFGFGITSKIIIAGLVSFFPVLINIIQGLKASEPDQIDMLRSLGASRFQIFRMASLPGSLPYVFAGLDIGIVFAILGALVGEFVGADSGLGYLLLQYNYRFNIAGVFSILIVLSLIGLIGHSVVRFIERRVVFWTKPDAIRSTVA